MALCHGPHDDSEYYTSNVDFARRASAGRKAPLGPVGKSVGPPDSPSVNTPATQTATGRLTRPQKEKFALAPLILEVALSDVVSQFLFEFVT